MADERLDSRRLKELSTKCLAAWARDTAFDWCLIVAAIWISGLYASPVSFLLAMLVVGNRQHALAILGHDGTHFTLSRNRRLNDILTNVFNMWPIGLTVEGYRKLHFQHHRGLGTDEDPELHHKRSRAPQWDVPASIGRIGKYALLDLVGYSVPDYKIIISFSKPEKTGALIAQYAFHVAGAGILAACGQWWALAVWYVSLPTSFMMFFRLRLWIEHQGTERTTRLHLNPWEGFLLSPHNGWYHWEHHNWASVPYTRLAELREAAKGPAVLSLKALIRHLRNLPYNASGVVFGTTNRETSSQEQWESHEQKRAA